MLWSNTSPDANTSEIRCLRLNTIALLRKAINEYQLGATMKEFLLNEEMRNANTSSRPIIVFYFRRPGIGGFQAKNKINFNQRPQVMNLRLS